MFIAVWPQMGGQVLIEVMYPYTPGGQKWLLVALFRTSYPQVYILHLDDTLKGSIKGEQQEMM